MECLQVRLWDVTDGAQVSRLTGHSDYVRAAAASPTSVDTWATGAAQRRVVRMTPNNGRMDRIFFTVPVNAVLSVTPSNVGTSTTCGVTCQVRACEA